MSNFNTLHNKLL